MYSTFVMHSWCCSPAVEAHGGGGERGEQRGVRVGRGGAGAARGARARARTRQRAQALAHEALHHRALLEDSHTMLVEMLEKLFPFRKMSYFHLKNCSLYIVK